MKVCMAATTFPRWAGDGQGAFVWGLARALTRQGLTVAVVAIHTPGAAEHETIEGIEVFRPRYWWREADELLRKDGGGLPITLRRYPMARIQLAPFFAGHMRAIAATGRDADVVHAHWTISGGAAVWSRAFHRRPVIVTVQGSDIFQVPKLPLGATYTRHVLGRCQRVTTLTTALRDAALKIGVDDSSLSVIPNGVDINEFVPAPQADREKVILFVGFLIQRKGVAFLLDAAAQVLTRHADYRVVILGEGPEEPSLREQASRLGIERSVEFLGFQPQHIVREWMRRAQIFVLPSVEEGQGVVLLEALASGTPVVGSDVDGIAEVITPAVGRLFPVGDSAALAERVLEIIEDAALCHRLAAAARQRAEMEYDWDRLSLEYIALYRQVL